MIFLDITGTKPSYHSELRNLLAITLLSGNLDTLERTDVNVDRKLCFGRVKQPLRSTKYSLILYVTCTLMFTQLVGKAISTLSFHLLPE